MGEHKRRQRVISCREGCEVLQTQGDGDLVRVNIPGKEDDKCITKIILATNHYTTVRS